MNPVILRQLDASIAEFQGYCGIEGEYFLSEAEWLVSAMIANGMTEDSVILSLQLLNGYYSVASASALHVDLHLSACCCGYLATCMSDDTPREMSFWEEMSPNSFSLQEFAAVVRAVTGTLSGRLYPVTSASLVRAILASSGDTGVSGDLLLLLTLYACSPPCYSLHPYKLAVSAVLYLTPYTELDLPSFNTLADPEVLNCVNYLHYLCVDTLGKMKNPSTVEHFLPVLPLISAFLPLGSVIRPMGDIPLERKDRIAPEISLSFREGADRPIGSGASGAVYIKSFRGRVVAVKEQEFLPNALRELCIMSQYKHPGLQSVLEFTLTDDRVYLSMTAAAASLLEEIYRSHSYSDGASASSSLWSGKKDAVNRFVLIPKPTRRSYASQLLLSLSYLHSCGVIHRDIKPGNILLYPNGSLKLADFGWSVLGVSSPLDFFPRYSKAITPAYRDINLCVAVLEGDDLSDYCFDVDVWSAAVVLMEMEMGCAPFVYSDDRTFPRLIEGVLSTEYPASFGPGVLLPIRDSLLRSLLLQMLDYNPKTRVTARQASVMMSM